MKELWSRIFIILTVLATVNPAPAVEPAVGIYRLKGTETSSTRTLSIWNDEKGLRLTLIVDGFDDERLLDEYDGIFTKSTDGSFRITWRRSSSSLPARPPVPALSVLKQTKTGIRITFDSQRPIELKRLTPLAFFPAGMYDEVWNRDRDLLFMSDSVADGGFIVRRNSRDGSLSLLWFDEHRQPAILPVTNWRFRVGSYMQPPSGERGLDPVLTGDLRGPGGQLWTVRFESERSPATDASLVLMRPGHPDLAMIGFDPLTLWVGKDVKGEVMEAMGPASNVAIYRWKSPARPEGILLKPEPDEKNPGRLRALYTNETYIWTGKLYEEQPEGAMLTLPDGTTVQFEEKKGE